MSRMSDTQYGVLYKMNGVWGLRSCLDNTPWLTKIEKGRLQTSRLTRPTLHVLYGNGWVIPTVLIWPIQRWELTRKGREALNRECLKRGAVLKAMA